MNIKPIGNKIMVKPLEQKVETEEKKEGGIIIPNIVNEINCDMPKVEVIAFGSQVRTSEVEKGDNVLVAKFTGSEVVDEETKEKYLMVELADLIAIEKK